MENITPHPSAQCILHGATTRFMQFEARPWEEQKRFSEERRCILLFPFILAKSVYRFYTIVPRFLISCSRLASKPGYLIEERSNVEEGRRGWGRKIIRGKEKRGRRAPAEKKLAREASKNEERKKGSGERISGVKRSNRMRNKRGGKRMTKGSWRERKWQGLGHQRRWGSGRETNMNKDKGKKMI